jgi:hypothetical protein
MRGELPGRFRTAFSSPRAGAMVLRRPSLTCPCRCSSRKAVPDKAARNQALESSFGCGKAPAAGPHRSSFPAQPGQRPERARGSRRQRKEKQKRSVLSFWSSVPSISVRRKPVVAIGVPGFHPNVFRAPPSPGCQVGPCVNSPTPDFGYSFATDFGGTGGSCGTALCSPEGC